MRDCEHLSAARVADRGRARVAAPPPSLEWRGAPGNPQPPDCQRPAWRAAPSKARSAPRRGDRQQIAARVPARGGGGGVSDPAPSAAPERCPTGERAFSGARAVLEMQLVAGGSSDPGRLAARVATCQLLVLLTVVNQRAPACAPLRGVVRRLAPSMRWSVVSCPIVSHAQLPRQGPWWLLPGVDALELERRRRATLAVGQRPFRGGRSGCRQPISYVMTF